MHGVEDRIENDQLKVYEVFKEKREQQDDSFRVSFRPVFLVDSMKQTYLQILIEKAVEICYGSFRWDA